MVNNIILGMVVSASIMYLSLIKSIIRRNNGNYVVIGSIAYGKTRKCIYAKLSSLIIGAGLFGGVIGGIISLF